ncbi:UDP-GalNAc:beta-1,3-N-acetylgalactosaminyltransferase 2-like isoform X2 [Lycorma delicatula]|uniref:UDP-GalNAc:beta-1, 3-N-acetylgalactosaminyltransferase 2-like isoform X2 n=1 Tax=Lycorma delicatula TaxID=130591 RepID=UPI003F50F17F
MVLIAYNKLTPFIVLVISLVTYFTVNNNYIYFNGVNREKFYSTVEKVSNCSGENSVSGYKGFSFLLNHGIILHYTGIQLNILKKCKNPIRLILVDAITSKKIASSTFIYSNEFNKVNISWKGIKKILLPTGFEGKFFLEGDCAFEENNCANLIVNDKTNIIRFLHVFNGNMTFAYTNHVSMHFGFNFSVRDVNSIHELISKKNEAWTKWRNHKEDIMNQLKNEINLYKDILLLDIIDVYSNLPLKMLNFYRWLNIDNKNYKYILKTDDDVFLDIPKLIKELITNNAKKWDWWSCFRLNWPVQRAGKWRELYLNLSVYPTFPSGAGYVLHYELVKYINKNFKNLPLNIQGEDVAVGLWLNNLNPKINTGKYCQWSCDDNCKRGTCNIIELNISSMYTVWEKYIACNNTICWC